MVNREQRALSLVNNFADLNQAGVHEIVSGRGVFVRDAHGNELLDGLSSLWSAPLGHSRPELVDAAAEQLSRLGAYHAAADKVTAPAVELCERLRDIAPGDVRRVLLTNSGSEANDTQVKLLHYLWHWRGERTRTRFVARHGAFHGTTLGAASLSDPGRSGAAFGGPVLDVLRIAAPCPHWNAEPGESDAEFVRRLATELDDLVVSNGPETIAGVVLEPVLGAGGIVVPPDGYYAAIQEVTRRHRLRLVVDEVITGFGRTGAMWGSETFGITPDSTSVAKGITNGFLPLGAVLVDDEMDQALRGQSAAFGTFAHGFTTGGHPVTAAVAVRTLELFEKLDVLANVRAVAPVLQSELRRATELPGVVDVRGVGMLAGVELGGADAVARVADVVRACAARGLIVRGIGRTVCLCPPLVMTEDEVMVLVDRLFGALREVGA